ncbi:hypothetical protein PF001_g31129 [Phytophthora fragariae]|uniref:Uncharacterized protein n=1 Tax=Phytophthora fragariae TaxID=53985 RepID=A0A6A4B007_9STRA|nr:hypothetical protein PF001_g31129 [Phytophthora fragariae]
MSGNKRDKSKKRAPLSRLNARISFSGRMFSIGRARCDVNSMRTVNAWLCWLSLGPTAPTIRKLYVRSV